MPDLDLLIDAAEAAGQIALKHFKANPETWEKEGGQGPVTEADLEIDRMLKAELTAARPSYGWLSEETEDTTTRLEKEHVFIVDPIDGTRAFIAGHENFSHSLAITLNGKVVAGAVHMPVKKLTYAAALGKRATLNGTPVSNSNFESVEGARILAAGSQFKPEFWNGNPPPVERHFRSSLAYRLCLVAEGRFDGMVTFRPAWEWDVAAGDLIGKEAGARVGTKHGGDTVYNNPDPRLPGMISAAPMVYAGLMTRL